MTREDFKKRRSLENRYLFIVFITIIILFPPLLYLTQSLLALSLFLALLVALTSFVAARRHPIYFDPPIEKTNTKAP